MALSKHLIGEFYYSINKHERTTIISSISQIADGGKSNSIYFWPNKLTVEFPTGKIGIYGCSFRINWM
jgi:hypothetical protein